MFLLRPVTATFLLFYQSISMPSRHGSNCEWSNFATSLLLADFVSGFQTVTTPEWPPVATNWAPSVKLYLLNLEFMSIILNDFTLSISKWPDSLSNRQIRAIMSLELVTSRVPSWLQCTELTSAWSSMHSVSLWCLTWGRPPWDSPNFKPGSRRKSHIDAK